MYCTNCGTRNNDQAKYCIKCGQQLGAAIVVGKNQQQTEKKSWNLFAVLISLALVIVVTIATAFDLWPWSPKTDNETSDARTEQIDEEKVVRYEDDTVDTAGTVIQEQTELETIPVPEATPVPETETYAEPSASWHGSMEEHPDIDVNSALSMGKSLIWNFNDSTAVGAGIDSDAVTETEADYGFVISVKDSDAVIVVPYANMEPAVTPTGITAELATEDYDTDSVQDVYEITGYADCPNGVGLVIMSFSNGECLTAGVFKEDGRLYAVNVSKDKTNAELTIDSRILLEQIIAENGLSEEDGVFTDPIYYPIVPVASGETTDTKYWIDKSFEITEPDWTDAHKVMAIYNYIVDNFAYDNWVISQGANSRVFLYEDFTGNYYISRTHVGVCEDFSQVFAVMCRGQNIPSYEIHNGNHAVSAAYIEDYGRWLLVDTTPDVRHQTNSEDYTVQSEHGDARYKHINRLTIGTFDGVAIGNDEDVENFGIDMFPY